MTPASACLGKGNKVAMTARANTVERRICPPQAPNQAKLAVVRGTAYNISATVYDYFRTGSTSNGPAPGAAAAIALVRSQVHGLAHVILRYFNVAGQIRRFARDNRHPDGSASVDFNFIRQH
jgi:hypothetical protein